MNPYAAMATINCSRERWNHCPNADAAIGLPEDHGEKQPDDADDGGFADPSHPEPVHVEAHEQGEGDRHADGERAPRALLQAR